MAAKVRLFDPDGFFMRHITRRQAGELLREDRLDEIQYRGRFWGYMLRPKHKFRISSPVITLGDILANARITSGPIPDETRIKVAQDKINAWPETYDTKAPIISAGRAQNVIKYSAPETPLLVCSWPKWDASWEFIQLANSYRV